MALVYEATLTKTPFSEERMSWCDNIEANLAQRLKPILSAMYVSKLEQKRTYPEWLPFISKKIHLLLGIQSAIFQRLHGITQLLCIPLFLCLVCSLTKSREEALGFNPEAGLTGKGAQRFSYPSLLTFYLDFSCVICFYSTTNSMQNRPPFIRLLFIQSYVFHSTYQAFMFLFWFSFFFFLIFSFLPLFLHSIYIVRVW